MFSQFNLYTHNRMLDAAVYVLKREVVGGEYKLWVVWHTRRGMNLGMYDTVKIREDEVKNWYAC